MTTTSAVTTASTLEGFPIITTFTEYITKVFDAAADEERLEAEEAEKISEEELQKSRDRSNGEDLYGVAHGHDKTSVRAYTIWSLLYQENDEAALILLNKLWDEPDFDVNWQYNAEVGYGFSLLHIAVYRNMTKTATRLLSHPKIMVNIRDKAHSTPLLARLELGWCEACDLLLARSDVYINAINEVGLCVIEYLISQGNLEAIKRITASPHEGHRLEVPSSLLEVKHYNVKETEEGPAFELPESGMAAIEYLRNEGTSTGSIIILK